MHEYCLQFSWFAFSWKLQNVEFGQLSLKNKGKNIKDFHFYNNADEMKKKKVFSKPLFFFSEKEDVTVDVDIGYVGRSNNIIAVD